MTRVYAVIQRNLPIALAVSFLVGAVLGLVVLGWWLWPVQWTDATPADLTEEYRHIYITLIADSYALNKDAELAQARLARLESGSQTASTLRQEIEQMAQAQASAQDAESAARLQAVAALVDSPTTLPAPGEPVAPPVPGASQGTVIARLLRVCGLVVLVLVILAGLLLLVYFLQSRAAGGAQAEPRLSTAAAGSAGEATAPAIMPQPTVAPSTPAPAVVGDVPPLTPTPSAEATTLGPFVATYSLGDIDYDMSFGIESPTGDFLGECGLGMAETIGGGDVQRVTAFEVWLFDKTDIRTVSLVLASAHAQADPALRAKLASRGEVVLAQPGNRFSIRTSSLKLDGQVLDLAYGGGDVPAQSYFTSFSVELTPVLLDEESE